MSPREQDATVAAALAHLATQPTMTALPFTLAGLPFQERGEGRERAPLAWPFPVRRCVRALVAVLPAWAVSVFTVCLIVPGPFDELAAVLAALVLLVVRFPRARAAWKGGKSHRKAEAR